MTTAIRTEPLDPWREIARYEAGLSEQGVGYGACASFVGTMRDHNEGDPVDVMFLEHYPGMTERALQKLETDASGQWPLDAVLILHRIGELHPGDPIVLVATWSSHRKAAFESCRAIMEELKSTVPFWKRETLAGGESRWVEKNTAGY